MPWSRATAPTLASLTGTYSFVPWVALNWRHSNTALFTLGVESNCRRTVEQESQEGFALAFKSYG